MAKRRLRTNRTRTRTAVVASWLALVVVMGGLTGTASTFVTAAPADAAIVVPPCTAGIRLSPDPYVANCRMGQAGASMSLNPTNVTPNGFTEGTFTMTLPAGSAVCGSCAIDGHYYGSAGIQSRLYKPGAAKATYDTIGLYFQASITNPVEYDLFGGGSFSGTYAYKDPGGQQGALIVSAFISISGNGNAESIASDDVIQFGSSVAPPTCKPPKPTIIGAQASQVVLAVQPCAGSPINVEGYRVATYIGNAATPSQLQTYNKASDVVVVSGVGTLAESSFTIEPFNTGGSGPTSDRSTRTIPPFTSTAALVDRQIRDFAGRAPTPGEAVPWTTAIGNGSKAPKTLIAENLKDNVAWRTSAPVIRLFRAYFLRIPDIGGLNYWTGKLRSGTSLNTVSANFAGSNEFKTRYGTLTNAEFVNLVYQNVLGRPGDAGGVSYWTNQLNLKKKNRGQVMTGFSESNENQNKTKGAVDVIRTFAGMLGRTPTAGEVTTWSPAPNVDLVQSLFSGGPYGTRISAMAAPILTTTSLGTAKVGTAYSLPLTALGGKAPLAWSVSAGNLPAGLSLNPSTGVISGTPTTVGTQNITIRVSDASARVDTSPFSLQVIPA